MTICNCQFYPEKLGHRCSRLLASFVAGVDSEQASDPIDLVLEMEMIRQMQAESDLNAEVHPANINMQGIIHLTASQALAVSDLLRKMLYEQQHKGFGYHFLKQSYLETVLVLVKRVQIRQYQDVEKHSTRTQRMVMQTLDYLAEHYAESINFEQLATQKGISLNYFRTLFKNITGLSPVDYLNRLRILNSLKLLQTTYLPISDIAAMVGILDSNYFSRLFKKIIGYSPIYFKRIK